MQKQQTAANTNGLVDLGEQQCVPSTKFIHAWPQGTFAALVMKP